MEPFDNRKELVEILKRYLAGKATFEEKLFVEKWYESFDATPDLTDEVPDDHMEITEQRIEANLRNQIRNSTVTHSHQFFPFFRKLAASILFLFFAGALYYFYEKRAAAISRPPIALKDLTPGGNKATLILDDGTQVALDDASVGILAQQGNSTITKLKDGTIGYTRNGRAVAYGHNTIRVPAGGQFEVVLSDGSHVFLNAESSLKFPTTFSDSERTVSITGEVYFEVSKDKQRPFYVEVGTLQKVKVLGTRFNIKAYGEEGSVTTTLLEGSVKIISEKSRMEELTLKPGEQSIISAEGKMRIRQDVNTSEIIAWKNGRFQFEKADIETVMSQFGRWYNVDVTYEGKIPDKKFSGKLDRNINASEALEILSYTGLNFRVEKLPSGEKKGSIVVLP